MSWGIICSSFKSIVYIHFTLILSDNIMKEKFNLERELKKFHFSSDGIVEFYQIDALQVLYNIQYLYIFENSRLAYMRKLGFVEKLNDLRSKFPVLTVHHTIDYFNPGFYGDEYTVYCRISQIRTSSFSFENIMIKKDGTLLSRAETVYVYIDQSTMQSTPIPEEIKNKIIEFEQNDCEIKSNSK